MRVLLKFLLPLFSIGLAALLLEAGLWTFGLLRPFPRYAVGEGNPRESRNFAFDPDTGWRMRPNVEFRWGKETYRANSQGFRAEDEFDPDDPRFKIVFVGDSFTWGTGAEYPETFPSLIDERLPSAAVFNLAEPGFGVDQMYLSAKTQALELNPQLLVVAICDADLKRSQTAFREAPERREKPAFKLVDGKLEPKTVADRFGPVMTMLEHHSRVWMGLRYAMRAVGYAYPVGEWWTLNEALLDEIQALGREHDIPVLFVYVPTVAWRPFPTMRQYMERTGASYISLRDGNVADPPALYRTKDGHFNTEGHLYAADKLLRWIEANFPEPSLRSP